MLRIPVANAISWRVLAATGLLCAMAHAAGENETDALVLETLLKQQAAAYDAIKTVEMEYTYRIERIADDVHGPEGNVAISGGREIRTGTIKCNVAGPKRHAHHAYQREFPDRHGLMREVMEQIFTPDQFISYAESANQVRLYHLDSRREVDSSIALQRDAIPWKDPLYYGFLPGKSELLAQFKRDYSSSREGRSVVWDVQGGRGGPFKITVRMQRGETSQIRRELVIDQNCGFLVTMNKAFDEDGRCVNEVMVEPHKSTSGIWVPGAVRESSVGNGWLLEISILTVKVNESIPAERYTMESMAFDRQSTWLVEYAFPGHEGVAKAFYGGTWVPRQQLPEEELQRMRSIQRNIPETGGFGGIWVHGAPVRE